MWVQAKEKVPTAKVVHLPVRDNQIIQINRRLACRLRAVHRAKTKATTATMAGTATAARVIRMTVETVATVARVIRMTVGTTATTVITVKARIKIVKGSFYLTPVTWQVKLKPD